MTESHERSSAQRLNRRAFLRGLALTLAGAGLAACGASGGTSGGGTGPTAGASGASSGASGGSITFTSWSLNEAAPKAVIQQIVDSYAKQRSATVKTTPYPYNEYLNQVLLQARGKTISGAAQLDIAWLASLASMGVLKDLGAQAQDAGYTDAAKLSGQAGGKQLGLPWTTASIGMVANKELLEKAGVSALPTTIDEFEAALEKIKGLGNGIIPYAAMTDVAQLKDCIPWIWTFGGTIVKDGQVTLGDEGSVKAAEWYKSLLDRGYIAPDVDRFDARQLFSQGKAAFYDDAILAKSAVTKDSPVADLASKIVPVPRPVLKSGDTPRALLWGHVIAVFEGENSDAAADFARFITADKDSTLTYFKALTLPPTTTAALSDEAVKQDSYISSWSQQITSTASPDPFWNYAETAQMEKLLGEQIQATMTGTSSAKDAMDKANQAISKLIK